MRLLYEKSIDSNLQQSINIRCILDSNRVDGFIKVLLLLVLFSRMLFICSFPASIDNTFREELEDVQMQFSIFSATNSSAEVEDIYTLLKIVYDKCSLTITGNTFLHMFRLQSTLMIDDVTVNPTGTGWVWHYAVDYNIMMQKN